MSSYWKDSCGIERYFRDHPYKAPFRTYAEAEEWAAGMRKLHSDDFLVVEIKGGFGVVQDIPNE